MRATSKLANKTNRCDCGARKLVLDKRCIKCQIKRKDEAGRTDESERSSESESFDRWTAVETFMEGVK
jgi:hypothetical protein